jgi:hypothetical protein
MKILIALVTALLLTQRTDDPQQLAMVMKAVRAAIAPVTASLPAADVDGAVPVGNNTEALWMVMPDPTEYLIEFRVNPLNAQNQREAARAMALIERNIEAAQRRAAAQYDRAVEEARRTGKSQEVDGVTLSDEGVEGAKIDAESQVVIETELNRAAYNSEIKSGAPPVLTTQLGGAVAIVAFPANTYKDAQTNADRYFAAEAMIFVGRLGPPKVSKSGDNTYGVLALTNLADRQGGINNIVVKLKGNEAFVKELLNKSNWSGLAELTR